MDPRFHIHSTSGHIAHASQGGNVCEASGYASRFRDDGNGDFEKELKHPDSKVYSTKAGTGAPLFIGKTIPLNRWIGMNFLVYNVDAGINFPSGDISGCPNLMANRAITEGHGTLLLRTDNEKCEWKMVSIREIQVDKTVSILLQSKHNIYTLWPSKRGWKIALTLRVLSNRFTDDIWPRAILR